MVENARCEGAYGRMSEGEGYASSLDIWKMLLSRISAVLQCMKDAFPGIWSSCALLVFPRMGCCCWWGRAGMTLPAATAVSKRAVAMECIASCSRIERRKSTGLVFVGRLEAFFGWEEALFMGIRFKRRRAALPQHPTLWACTASSKLIRAAWRGLF